MPVQRQDLLKSTDGTVCCAQGSLISKLVKTADSDRKDGIVNYADFVRMLGESARSESLLVACSQESAQEINTVLPHPGFA